MRNPGPGQCEAAIITGAGRGIGRSIALSLASRGLHVLCVSRTENAEETAAIIRRNGGRAEGLILDLSDTRNTEDKLTRWSDTSQFRRVVTILAAATLGPSGPLIETPIDTWSETLSINILGNLAVVRGVLPLQLRNAFGRILFFAGGGAAYAYPVFPAYAASKTALVRIAENLHEDLKSKGDFAVAILAPGAVETDTLATVRARGGYVRTTVPIQEPTAFAVEFACSTSCGFSGCFVHVRDVYRDYLNNSAELPKGLWKLRRTE